jgi:arginase
MTLYLNFPQWQGSGKTNELYLGANLICEKLTQYQWVEIPVQSEENLTIDKQILGYSSIKRQLVSAKNLIDKYKPEKMFTVGGGCDVDIIPASYLNQKYNGDLVVLWIDAHGDLNTPESSPSKNFHGMPLRVLFGEGENEIVSLVKRPFLDSQVYLAGIRDLDQPEKEFIKAHQLKVVDLTDTVVVSEFIEDLGQKKLYIHLDLDAIDPNEYPFVKCPTANGLPLQSVKTLFSLLAQMDNLVGGSIVEYVPGKNTDGLEIACELFTSLVK